jgi:aminoglycoside 6'-N-acetyltransferase
MADVQLRRLTSADLPQLAHWLAQPHVARFWPDRSDLASVTAHYTPALVGDDPTVLFKICAGHRAVGMIQLYRVRDEPNWALALPPGLVRVDTAAGVDYLIGEADALLQGIGSAAIAACAALSFRTDPDVDQVVAAPQQENTGSWRALDRAGFRRVWAGQLDSDDPSDAGPAFVYTLDRDAGTG